MDVLTTQLTAIAKVYIIGGDGTQKGANAIYEVFSVFATANVRVRTSVQDIMSNIQNSFSIC